MNTVAISTLNERYLLSNYGTFFQHYALRTVLKEMGLSPFRVSYPSGRFESRTWPLSLAMDFLRPVYWMMRRLPNRRELLMSMVIRNHMNLLFRSDFRRLIGAFREPQAFQTDTVGIMGGDQVLSSMDKRVWLNDIPSGNRRITYAVSADWEAVDRDGDWKKFASEQLKHFSFVGIRELAGVKVCKSLVDAGQPVRHVVDPVMLLTRQDFESIATARRIWRRPVLFCYLLNIRSAEEMTLEKYEWLAKKLGCELRILGLQGAENFVPRKYRVALRPSGFLRALLDADYFITNSYHGSVFAILFEKNFISLRQNCPVGSNQNVRQEELMAQFSLTSRWKHREEGAESWIDAFNAKIDWPPIRDLVATKRNVSHQLLLRALSGKMLGEVQD